MGDRLLVEALRSGDPIAMGAVYDGYAERLYGYCWFQLRNVDAAQVALRDTLMCAEAHIGKLRAPARFGAWLYALARVECHRRRPAGSVQPDLPVARHDQDDVDLRLMAWRAVTGLPPLSRELLDLRHRHGMDNPDIAPIVGLRSKEVGELLAEAGVLLEAALIAEILAHDGLDGCARRTTILRPRKDEIDDDLREALVRHSLECARCARHLPHNIAPGKVYALLPRAPLPATLRAQLMNCFTDPELAGYRLFAAARVSRFGAHGFPVQPGSGRTAAFDHACHDVSHRTARGWARAVTAAAGAVITAMSGTALCRYFGEDASHASHGVVAAPPGVRSPLPRPARPGDAGDGRPVSAAQPLRPSEVLRPAIELGGSPSKDLLWAPDASAPPSSPTSSPKTPPTTPPTSPTPAPTTSPTPTPRPTPSTPTPTSPEPSPSLPPSQPAPTRPASTMRPPTSPPHPARPTASSSTGQEPPASAPERTDGRLHRPPRTAAG